MVTEIKNGITIIHTGDSAGGLKNKNGVCGVTFYEKDKKYRAEITIKKRKFLLGFFDEKEMAADARKVAEIKRKEGTLEEWLKTKPHGNSERFYDFWKEEFAKCDL